MKQFKQFQRDVKSLGGVWSGEDVYFSYGRDGFRADYNPNYPKAGAVAIIEKNAPWLSVSVQLGEWELIKYDKDAGRVMAHYYKTLEELREGAGYDGLRID